MYLVYRTVHYTLPVARATNHFNAMILPRVWHGLSSRGEHSVKNQSAGDIIYATPCADYHLRLYATNVWAKEETTTYYDYFTI